MNNAFLALVLSGGALGFGQNKPSSPPASVDTPVFFPIRGAPRVIRDISCSASPDLRFDVYVPSRGRNHAVVLLLHGKVDPRTVPKPKEWRFFRDYGQLMSAAGFVAVVPNHRLEFAEATLKPSWADVLEVLSEVRRNAGRFHADPARIGVVVYSGGGALLAEFLQKRYPGVRCLAGFYPGLSPAMTAAVSMPDAPHLPLLIVRAGKDTVPGINSSIDAFAPVALKSNFPLVLINYPEGEHGFENRQQTAGTQYAISAALEFLESNLRAVQ
jgi:dienelactone hydrolase